MKAITVFRGIRFRHLPLTIGILLVTATIFILWLSSWNSLYIDKNFTYSADLQTTSSKYDSASSRYQAPEYTLTTYGIQPTSTDKDSTLLKETVDTTQFNGLPLERSTQFWASSKTGRVYHNGTVSYVMGPRNIQEGQSFNYWYSPHKKVVLMHYAGTDTLFGLPAYSYTTEFSYNTTDTQLKPGTNQDIARKIGLQIWIEPTTGWLIKSQVTNNDYYRTAGTASEKSPARYATSNFTEASVRQHVAYAKQLKTRLDFGLQVAPSLLLIAALLAISGFIIVLCNIRSVPVEATLAIVLAASIANLVGWATNIKPLQLLFPGDVAVNPLVSICFMSTAICVLLLYYRRLQQQKVALVLGGITAVATFVCALGIAHILPFRLDEILWKSEVIDASVTTPAHMSLFGCLALGLISLGIMAAAFGVHDSRARYIARFAAGMGVSLGTAGLLSKLILLDEFFVQPDIASLSIGGSVLCVLASLALLQVLWHRYPISGPRQPFYKIIAKPAAITLPLIAIGVVAQLQQNVIQQRLESAFGKQTATVQNNIERDVTVYTNTLTGAKALYSASVSVERNEWHQYVSALDSGKNYPGMLSLNFADVVQKNQTAALTSQARASGYGSFDIFPTGQRDTYAVVLYAEPPTAQNNALLGYDMYSDVIRKSALQQAEVSGKATISNKITLLQETGSSDRNGFLLTLPVYANKQPIATPEQRRAALEGYVFAPLDTQIFFDAVMKDLGNTVSVAIYDGFGAHSNNLLYGAPPNVPAKLGITKTETIYVNDHPWTIVYSATNNLSIGATQERAPGIILVGGCTVYLMGLATFLWLTASRHFTRRAKDTTRRL